MMWKKLGKSILFPHISVMLVLLPVATVLLVYSMMFLDSESAISYISYVLSAYTLTIWCLKIPQIINYAKNFKQENKFAVRWFDDANLRVNVSLLGSFLWNTAYAVFQFALGLYHHTFWYYSMAAYYVSLAAMRFFLVRHTRKYSAGKEMQIELRKYRACGIVFLVMNMSLSLMIFFMVYWNRTFNHNEITTIAMAAYTFGSLAVAITNVVKYRKYNSPVYSASKAISIAAASVSMLTLESTMLTTFNDGTMTLSARKIMLGASGIVISVFIVGMAVYMIVRSSKKIKLLRNGEGQIL